MRQYPCGKSKKKTLESFVDKDITQVSDPTFLLDMEYWQSLVRKPSIQRPYILLFTLSHQPKILRYALRLSYESGLLLYSLAQIQPETPDGAYTAVRDAGPYEWLGYLAGANMVITDSFHGTVFSMLLGSKNFYTYIKLGNKRASRILDLLSALCLKGHVLNPDLIQSYAELDGNHIDRSLLLSRIAKQQAFSREYLLGQLLK